MQKARPTVLIAEDDATARSALSIRLTQAGFDVITASDGAAAVDLLEKRTPDAALLDVQMPRLDGFAVCEHIRRNPATQKMPVFFLTGTTDGVIRNHLGTLTSTVGGDHHFTKPYDGKLIAMLLWDAVGGPRTPTG